MSCRVIVPGQDPYDGLASSTPCVLVTRSIAAVLAQYPTASGLYPGAGSSYVICQATRRSVHYNLDKIRVDITQSGTLGDSTTPMKFTITRNGITGGTLTSTKPTNIRDTYEFAVGEAILQFQNVDQTDYEKNGANATPLTYGAGDWIEFTANWSPWNSVGHDADGKPDFNLPHDPPRFTSSGFTDRTLGITGDWVDIRLDVFELTDPNGSYGPLPPNFDTDTLAAATVGERVIIDTGLPVVGFWQVGTIVTDGDFFLPLPLTQPIPGATRATTSPVGYVSPVPPGLQGQPGEFDTTTYSIIAKTSDGRYWLSSKPPTSPPWEKATIVVGTGGALGTFDFVATVNGRSWPSGSTTANHSGSFEFQVPGVGLKLLFAAGTYVAGSTYTVDTTPLVSLSPTAIDAVTIESYNLGSDSEFWVSSLTTISARSPGDPSLVEVSPGQWRYCVAQ